MDKIAYSTFDFFSQAIPGMYVLVAFLMLGSEIHNAGDVLHKAGQIKIGTVVFLLVTGYILGFAITPVGRCLYRTLGFKLWFPKLTNDINLYISDKFILIREYSNANFKYVETWNMYCIMSHNLALASIALLITALIKCFTVGSSDLTFWAAICALSVVLFFLFLHRAVRFSVWAADDLNAAIRKLKLLEKANS